MRGAARVARLPIAALPALAAVLALLGGVLALSGCVAAVPAAGDRQPAAARIIRPLLDVTDWAVLGGRLSVVVRNDGRAPVRAARAVVTARDLRGTVVAAASGLSSTGCCLVTDLAPGARAAVFVDIGTAARRVSAVRVDVVPVAQPTAAAATAGDIGLQTGVDTTAVRAVLTATARAEFAVQAVLTDPSGSIVTVLAASARCLDPAVPATVELDAPSPAPPGTLISSVTAQVTGPC